VGSFLAEAKRHGSVGADEIRHHVGERELRDIEVLPGYERIALID
jgi:hypothetical protein